MLLLKESTTFWDWSYIKTADWQPFCFIDIEEIVGECWPCGCAVLGTFQLFCVFHVNGLHATNTFCCLQIIERLLTRIRIILIPDSDICVHITRCSANRNVMCLMCV